MAKMDVFDLRFFNKDQKELVDLPFIDEVTFSDKVAQIQDLAKRTPAVDEFGAIQFDNILHMAEARQKTVPEQRDVAADLPAVGTFMELWRGFAGLEPVGKGTGTLLSRSMQFEGGIEVDTPINEVSYISCTWSSQKKALRDISRKEARQQGISHSYVIPRLRCSLIPPRFNTEKTCFYNEESAETECGPRKELEHQEWRYPYKLFRGITTDQEIARYKAGQQVLEEFATLYEGLWEELSDKLKDSRTERWKTEEEILAVIVQEQKLWEESGLDTSFLKKIRGKHRPMDF